MNSVFEYFKSVYKNKNILVTGHTGFKGSWLCNWLNEFGANIIGYALDLHTQQDNYTLSDISNLITDIRADIRDYDKLESVFQKYKPDFVFHLAAQALVREGYQRPKETFDTNIGGTVNVLENCRHSKNVKVIINITSDKCYENREWIWGYRESDPMGGFDPYSSSKGSSELVTAAYRNSFFNPQDFNKHKKALSSVRAGNVIGGGDWAKNRLIPDCIRALKKGESIKVRNPQSIRPWQFVLEPLGGYLLLGARMFEDPNKFSSAWNFGPEKTSIVTVKKVVELVLENWGSGDWESPNIEEPHEAKNLSLDISKARFDLNWSPILDIEKSVEMTINWYKELQKSTIMSTFIKNQIIEYMELMSIK